MIPDAILLFIISMLLTLIFDEQVPLILVFALDLVEVGFIIEAGGFVTDTAFYLFLFAISMVYTALKMIRLRLEEEK